MYHILICDDDRDIAAALEIYLTSPEHKLYLAYDGAQALKIARENPIQLVLMDIMMPGVDGISATAALRRENCNVPVILLTAKTETSDKILGLNVGADDYITKPFDPMEVLARVKAQLRRYTALGGQETAPGTLAIGQVTLDDETKRVCAYGQEIALTPIEYAILKLLMRNAGKYFPAARSTASSGAKRRSAQTPWRCISATCARRSSCHPPTRGISRSSGGRGINSKRSVKIREAVFEGRKNHRRRAVRGVHVCLCPVAALHGGRLCGGV